MILSLNLISGPCVNKQSSIKTDQNIAKFKKALLATFDAVPDIFITSAETQGGRDEVLGFIGEVNRNFEVPEYDSEFYK